jgi:transposase
MGNTVTTVTIATSEYESLTARMTELEHYNTELEALVKYYEEQLRLNKHRQFGSSSEQAEVSEQLGLFDEAENTADLKQPEPDTLEITYQRRKCAGKREEDLSGLPTEVVGHDLPESERVCPECGGGLRKIGEDVRRELEIIPAKVKVVEHRQAVYACRYCELNTERTTVVRARAPEPVIKGSIASPSAIAHIMAQKYVMAIPLYRQEQSWQREGVHLSRQTMANWIIRAAEDFLKPIYKLLRTDLLLREVLHADETTCQVLHEPGKKANTNSYMWLYQTSGDTIHPIILFEYQATRSSTHPKRFLEGWSGYLHADGYSGYHNLPPGITVIGCWVHLRRKFTDAFKAAPEEARPMSRAPEAIERMGALFHLESHWKDFDAEERQKLRLEQSKPRAEAFFAWLETLNILPKSKMGEAVAYALGQRRWLMNFYLDGRLELSNNRAENSIRPFVIGRKNWLFCNTQRGAQASSIVYSIIETAKANGLKPFDYLKFLFETVPNTSTGNLGKLLPWGEAVPVPCRLPHGTIKQDQGEERA